MQYQAPNANPARLLGEVPMDLDYKHNFSDQLQMKAIRYDIVYKAQTPTAYGPGLNIITIPVEASNFLDLKEARLSFDLTYPSVNLSQLDGGAWSVIKRLRIMNEQGAEIERCEDYNLYHTVMHHYTDSLPDAMQNSIMAGSVDGMNIGTVNNQYGGIWTPPTAVTLTAAAYASGNAANYASSRALTRFRQEDTQIVASGLKRHYEFKLKNGWFNPVGGKYLSPHVKFTVEITLELTNTAFVSSSNMASEPYVINNTELKIPMISILDPGFAGVINDLRNTLQQFRFSSYKVYYGAVTATATPQTSLQISDRSLSLKAMLVVARTDGQMAAANQSHWALSKHTIQHIADWQFTVGSVLYPPVKVLNVSDVTSNNVSAAWVDTANTTGTQSSSVSFPLAATTVNFNPCSTFHEVRKVFPNVQLLDKNGFYQSHLNNGAGILGISFEAYQGEKNGIGGINTKQDGVPITFDFATSAAVAGYGASKLEFLALMDVYCDILPGGDIRVSA